MKFLNSKAAALLTDMMCCILLGASVCAMLLPSAGLDVGYGDCLLLMAAGLAVVFLFTRKWWLLPAFLGAAVAVTLLIATLFDLSEEIGEYLGGFMRWCTESYPAAFPYSFNGSIIAVKLAMTLPVAVITYLYYRRLFFFPLLPPAALALLLWIYLSGSEAFWPALVMLLLAIFLSAAKMMGNRINKSLPASDRISGSLLVMTAMALVPAVIFLAFSFSPKNDGDWRFKPLSNLVDDFRDYFGWGKNDGPLQGSFDIGVSGFSPLGQRLGGNISPDNTKVMKVTTKTPVLLKGAVYNSYDGRRWYDAGALRRFRFTGFLWQGMRRDVFDLSLPSAGGSMELLSNLTSAADLEINCTKRGRTVFAAGRVQSLQSFDMDISDVFFNGQSELFTQSPQNSLRYTLHTVVFDRNKAGFDSSMLKLEALVGGGVDSGFDAARSEYLQLPEALPQSVYNTAEEITRGCESAYEKAEAIERWLGGNCAYTLSPGSPPEGKDFVEHFLETREGYCVYYASAMTVLARAAGLPARYVTGYALKRNPASNADDAYLATNATAHAWTEVYFKGIGWLNFDALRWNSNEAAVVEQSAAQGSNYAMPTPTPFNASAYMGSHGASGSGMPTEVKVMLISLVCLITALALFAAVRFILLLLGTGGYYRRLCRKYGTNGERISVCYSKIIKQVSFLGLKQEPRDTISSFARRVDAYLGSREMTELCGCVIKMRFVLKQPDDCDVKALCALSVKLEKRLRADLGISGYLWRRILLGR